MNAGCICIKTWPIMIMIIGSMACQLLLWPWPFQASYSHTVYVHTAPGILFSLSVLAWWTHLKIWNVNSLTPNIMFDSSSPSGIHSDPCKTLSIDLGELSNLHILLALQTSLQFDLYYMNWLFIEACDSTRNS